MATASLLTVQGASRRWRRSLPAVAVGSGLSKAAARGSEALSICGRPVWPGSCKAHPQQHVKVFDAFVSAGECCPSSETH